MITDRKIPLETAEAEEFGGPEMREMKNRLLSSPMDLQRDSLIRVCYLRAGGRYILCVLTHSIAFDDARRNACLAGASDGALLAPVDAACAGQRRRDHAERPVRRQPLHPAAG